MRNDLPWDYFHCEFWSFASLRLYRRILFWRWYKYRLIENLLGKVMWLTETRKCLRCHSSWAYLRNHLNRRIEWNRWSLRYICAINDNWHIFVRRRSGNSRNRHRNHSCYWHTIYFPHLFWALENDLRNISWRCNHFFGTLNIKIDAWMILNDITTSNSHEISLWWSNICLNWWSIKSWYVDLSKVIRLSKLLRNPYLFWL